MPERPRSLRADASLLSRWRSCVAGALLTFAVLPAGCASAKQHYASPKAPATEVIVDLSSVAPQMPSGLPQPPVVATLRKVVILQRTGPLGLNSYWDEYVLSIANAGEQPVTIESTVLSDLHGKCAVPGDNLWILANAHKSWFERTDSRGVTSPGRIGMGSVAAGAIAPATGGWLIFTPTAYAACAAIVAPVYAVSAIEFNTSGRKRVEADFNRRRLVLPLTIAPGQTLDGSLYFPVTPGPLTLAFHCLVSGETTEMVLQLTPLAGLHLPLQGKP